VTDPKGFALADLLLGLGAAEEMERGGMVEKCAVCGFSQADFKKTGRLGCGECYQTFASGLETLLKGMHKGTVHLGKIPKRAIESIEREARLKGLRNDLRQAVIAEDYESAAQLRDQLKQLEAI